MNIFITLIEGILIGLIASIPLGPIGILCIQRTLSRGRLSGFVSGMGAATVDTIYAAIAGFGVKIIIDFVNTQSKSLQMIGGIMIAVIGVRLFFAKQQESINDQKQTGSLSRDFLSSFFITLYNPLTFFAFMATFASFNLVDKSQSIFFVLLLVFGILIGATLWWFVLTWIAGHYHKSFNQQGLWWLNKIAGVGIFFFGVYYSIWSFINLLKK